MWLQNIDMTLQQPDSATVQKALQMLNAHLERNKCRKTTERFAVLRAAFAMTGMFRLADLSKWLDVQNFSVSRVTLYKAVAVLRDCHLVVCHRIGNTSYYETTLDHSEGSFYKICTTCGKTTLTVMPAEVQRAIAEVRMRGFHADDCMLYVYGTCQKCQKKKKIEKTK